MSTPRQTDDDPGYAKLRAKFSILAGRELTVGIYEGEIATYAAANEFGTEHIPARPFFSTAMDQNGPAHAALLERQLGRVIASGANPDAALFALGVKVRSDVMRSIRDWTTPPNAPSTVERKGENNPLVDKGAAGMMGAVNFKVGTPGSEG